MREQYTEQEGYNPGSQMIQIAGISYLDPMDHFIKERLGIKWYIRYMDDFLLIDSDPERLADCTKQIRAKLADIGLKLNEKKTQILDAKDGVMFLGFRFKLTKTGKVLRLISSDNVKRERKKLRRMVHKAARGELTRKKVDECYQAWKAHASKGNTWRACQRMDAYYKELWREADEIQARRGREGAARAGEGAGAGGNKRRKH